MNDYFGLVIIASVPVFVAAVIYKLEDETIFRNCSYWTKQVTIGIVFGIIAIFGTEWGVPVNGAQINCRDAAVLTAGLLFGGPAGIIAGTIGAVERYIAVYWGVGQLTQIACTVATFVAGFYAAALRKYMFEDKKPGWGIAFAVGLVMETFHMTMVFVTNTSNPDLAIAVVSACTMPMLLANSISLTIATFVITKLSKDNRIEGKPKTGISQIIQRGLLIAVAISFVISSMFIFRLQTGLAESQTEQTLLSSVETAGNAIVQGVDEKELTHGFSVGKDGYLVIFDDDGKLIAKCSEMDEELCESVLLGLGNTENKTVFTAASDGIIYYCLKNEYKGEQVVAIMGLSEAYSARNMALYVNTFLEILIFGALFAVIYFIIKNVVVDRIKDINVSLSRISRGNLDEVIEVNSNAEFSSLSEDINITVDALKQYIKEAEARIDKELKFAKDIQEASLPLVVNQLKDRPEFDIFASMNTAKEVGGDFYDFYITDDGKLNFTVADVSGKGIPAAMFMMRSKTELRGQTEAGLRVNEVFTVANNALCMGNDAGMFVTAWQGNLDINTGEICFANAGHNPPLIRRNGKYEYLRSRAGLVLAGMEGMIYKEQKTVLEPGDIIFLYTDGLTEGNNLSDELYGEERLLEALNSNPLEDVNAICEYVKSELDKFVGEAPQFDDITMLALKYNGKEPEIRIDFEEIAIDNINEITEFVETELERMECPFKTIIQINIAIDEIYSNIVKFAYKDGKGPASIVLEELDNPHAVSITFIDKGVPYNPLTKEDPDISLSAAEREIGGLGIFITRKTMDEMRYLYENDQNILTLVKYF